MGALGTELRNKSREIVSLIVKANSTKDRLPRLLELRERVEELVILVRLCKEVKAFKSFKSFQFVWIVLRLRSSEKQL